MSTLSKAFKNILVVVKQTPYEQYLQLRAQGKAPVALRWERLKNRYESHKKCVDDVKNILENLGVSYSLIGREELHRGSMVDKDLVIAVGGDGTILNTASFMDDAIPVLGVNSDPTKLEEKGVTNLKDERRSRGALCGTTANTVKLDLPKIIHGNEKYGERTRIKCLIRSTYTETRMPPALNDILVTHPSPAAVSRFRLATCRGNVAPSYSPVYKPQEIFSFNVWSSGIWISTGSGSTAAMKSAGGVPMSATSSTLQYMVREQILEEVNDSIQLADGGMINQEEMLLLRWNSQHGALYVDGAHFKLLCPKVSETYQC
eukprot:gene22421-30673_t